MACGGYDPAAIASVLDEHIVTVVILCATALIASIAWAVGMVAKAMTPVHVGVEQPGSSPGSPIAGGPCE